MTKKRDSSIDEISRRTERLQESRDKPAESPLRGLGVFGVVGWSVAVPTVGGALLGMWLNRVAPQSFSWPLALILGGVMVGALIAWRWIDREGR